MRDNNLFDWQSGGIESKALPALCIVQEEGRKNDWAQTVNSGTS